MSNKKAKVVALSLGKGLANLGTIVSAMLMSRILSESQLGTFRQSILAYDMLTSIFCLGISQGVYYFLPAEKNRARGVVVDGLVVLFGMGILCGLFLIGGRHFLSEQFSNPDLTFTLNYLAFLPVVMLPASLVASVLVTQDKVTQLAVFNVVFNTALVSSMMLVCWVWKSSASIVIAKVLVSACFGLIALFLIYRALPRDDWRPSLPTIGKIFSFSIPLGFASLFGIFQANLDRLLVSSFCNPSEFAVYSNGAIEVPFIGIITASIATVILPELRRKIAEGFKNEALDLFRLAAEKSAVILIPIMLFLFVCAEPLMVFLFSDKYLESALPFRIYLLLLPARVVMYGSMMVALGLNRVVFYRTAAAAVVNLAVGYALVNWYGSIGAAIATVLTTFFVACGWSMWAIAKAVPCSFAELLPFRKMFELFGLSLLAIIPSLVLRICNFIDMPWLELLTSACFFFAALVIVAVVFDNELLLNIWRQTVANVTRRIRLQKVST